MSSLWALRGYTPPSSDASDAVSRANQAQERTRQLEERVDHLALISMAMWELLRERTDLTEGDLMEKVHQLDLRDGVPDGKITRTVRACQACGRTMSPRHHRCLYCGHERLRDSAFDTLR